MSADQRSKSLSRSAPPESPDRRRERKKFFRGWAGASIIGAVVIFALAAYALIAREGQSAVGIIALALIVALMFSAMTWLLGYLRNGRLQAQNKAGQDSSDQTPPDGG